MAIEMVAKERPVSAPLQADHAPAARPLETELLLGPGGGRKGGFRNESTQSTAAPLLRDQPVVQSEPAQPCDMGDVAMGPVAQKNSRGKIMSCGCVDRFITLLLDFLFRR